MSFDSIKKITTADMIDYLNKNCSEEERQAFSIAACTNKDGIITSEYNHLAAVRYFCKQYMPHLIPVAKPKAPNKSEAIIAWLPKNMSPKK